MRFITLLFILSLLNFPAIAAEKQSFGAWLEDFRKEAVTQDIDQEIIDEAFEDVRAPLDNVLELDQKQPEKVKSFSEYLNAILTNKRISTAKEQWHEHARILRRISAKYHVPAPVLLALWGIESNFGRNQGDFSVIQSLATLAYDGRRSQFFRSELIDALRIMQDEDIAVGDLTGSWAGAMGQTQFMPSSFLKFAVDFDDDGKKDIWNNNADALASIANYLHSKGWNNKVGWGIRIMPPQSADAEQWRVEKAEKSLKEWNKLGLRRENGRPLPRTNTNARLVIPDDESAAFLVFRNYDIIMDWNRSVYFATSVCLLADKIGKK